jgi:hypothetical protein
MKGIVLALGLMLSSSVFAWGECGTVTTYQWYQPSANPGGWGSNTQALPCPAKPATSNTGSLGQAAVVGAVLFGPIMAVDSYLESEKTRIYRDAQISSAVLSCRGIKDKFLVTPKEALYLDGKSITLTVTDQPGVYVQQTWFGLGKTRTIDLSNMTFSEGDKSTSCQVVSTTGTDVAQLQQPSVDLSREDPMVQYLAQQIYGK